MGVAPPAEAGVVVSLPRTNAGHVTNKPTAQERRSPSTAAALFSWPVELRAVLALTAASQDATCLVSGEPKRVAYNDRFAALVGAPPSPAIPALLDELLVGDRAALGAVVDRVLSTGEAVSGLLPAAAGGARDEGPLVVRGLPLMTTPGAPLAVQLVVSRLLPPFVDARRDAVMVWRCGEGGGEIEFWSDGAARLYGFSASEAVGTTHERLLQTRLSCRHQECTDRVARSAGWSGLMKRSHADGRSLWLRTRIEPHVFVAGDVWVVEVTQEVSAELEAKRRTRHGLPSVHDDHRARAEELRAMHALQDLGRRYVRGVSLERLLPQVAGVAATLTGASLVRVAMVGKFGNDDDDARGWCPPARREFRGCDDALAREESGLCAALPPSARVGLDVIEANPALSGSALLPALERARVREVMWVPLRLEGGDVWAKLWLFFRTEGLMPKRAHHWLEQLARQTTRIVRRMREEAALVHSEAKLQDAIEHAAVGFAILGPSGRLVGTNRALSELLGDEATSLDGVEEVALVHPDDRAAQLGTLQEKVASGTDSFVLENRYVSSTKGCVWVRKSISIVRGDDGSPRWYIVLVEDISRRMRAETSLQVAHDQLRASSRRKDEFLRMLSHELRNPLACLSNGLEILARAPGGSDVAARAVLTMQRQMGTLRHLVDDLLDIARIESGRFALRLEELPLDEVLRELCDDHQPDFVGAGLSLRFVSPPMGIYVRGDRTRLLQVMSNLLHNARKFTPAGGSVEVSLGRERQGPSGHHAAVRVRDTGRGIDNAFVERVFEPFAQIDPPVGRRDAGLGLGLPIARALAELHHGTLRVEKTGPQQGTSVLLTLPEVSPEATRASEPVPARTFSSQVLVIEDNDDARELLQTLVSLTGREVRAARDGEEGLRLAQEQPPDVILCDIGLPGLDGYGVVRELRKLPTLRDCRMVAVTGYASPEDVARGEAAGFDAHLAKPPALSMLEPLLRSKRHERA